MNNYSKYPTSNSCGWQSAMISTGSHWLWLVSPGTKNRITTKNNQDWLLIRIFIWVIESTQVHRVDGIAWVILCVKSSPAASVGMPIPSMSRHQLRFQLTVDVARQLLRQPAKHEPLVLKEHMTVVSKIMPKSMLSISGTEPPSICDLKQQRNRDLQHCSPATGSCDGWVVEDHGVGQVDAIELRLQTVPKLHTWCCLVGCNDGWLVVLTTFNG